MKKSKILQYNICVCFIICAFLGSVNFWCFNENFYENEHNKIIIYGNHVNDHIGISKDDLKELTKFTLDYLNDPKASLDKKMNIKGEYREVFTDDEKAHMVDVRRLNLASINVLIISFFVMSICIIICLFNRIRISDLRFIYRKVFIKFITVFSIIGIWVLIDFDSFWTLFHKIFFAGNDLWLLDLRKDILIMIVPPEFFGDLVTRILITFIFVIICLLFVLRLLDKKKRSYD